MKRKPHRENDDEEYIQEFLTNIGAGIGGSALGATLGYYVTGDIGNTVASALGSTALLFLAKRSDAPIHLIEKWQPDHLTRRLIRRKLSEDVRHSCLTNPILLNESLSYTQSIHAHEGVIGRTSPKRLMPCEDNLVIDEVHQAENYLPDGLIQQCLELLNRNVISGKGGNIAVSCSCIFTAAVATLKSLQKKYGDVTKYGNKALKLDVSYAGINARDQISKLKSDFPPDFIVTANDAYLLSANKSIDSYRRLFPCNRHSQSLFRRNGKNGRVPLVYIWEESSSDLQWVLGAGTPRLSQLEKISYAEQIPALVKNMSPGSCIYAWAPLSYQLAENPSFTELPGSQHDIWIFLFGSGEWVTKSLAGTRQAFELLFINEWKFCSRNRKHALHLLLNDAQYIKQFTYAAGLGVLPELET